LHLIFPGALVIKQLLSMTIAAAACAALLLSGVAGCSPSRDAQATAEVVPVPPGSFSPKWKATFDLDRDTLTELHVRPNMIFAYTRNHVAYGIDRNGGSLLFINPIKASGGVLRPPVVLNEQIVFPTAATFEIYSRKGRLERSLQLDYSTRSPASALGTTLFVGLDYPRGGRVAAIDITRAYGTTRWELLTSGGVSARPAVFEKTIFIGGEDGRIYAVAADRSPVWPLEGGVYLTSGRIVADVQADETGVYVASTDSKLYSVNRVTGKTQWQYFAGSALITPPELTETTVYQYVRGRGVVALDKIGRQFNREARWEVRNAVQFLAEDETNTYLRRRDNSIVAVDRQTGKEKFRSRTRFDVFASNTGDSTIFAATNDGQVFAITPVLKPGSVGEIVLLEERSVGAVSMAE
jgi:outer membrane protein assembly factor BamB